MSQLTVTPEHWLRGPLPDVPALLQPAAHALLQARDDIHNVLVGFPDTALWERPAGLASVGFHLKHIAGVQDRMLAYARGEQLTDEQFTYLRQEDEPTDDQTGHRFGQQRTCAEWLTYLSQQTDRSLEALRQTDPGTLSDYRPVGRAKLPSTVGGLLFHAAEHTMRHTGQLLVTARVLMG